MKDDNETDAEPVTDNSAAEATGEQSESTPAIDSQIAAQTDQQSDSADPYGGEIDRPGWGRIGADIGRYVGYYLLTVAALSLLIYLSD